MPKSKFRDRLDKERRCRMFSGSVEIAVKNYLGTFKAVVLNRVAAEP